MAEIQNTQSRPRNGFLSSIDKFTDYLYKYIDQQGQLSDKMYAFNRKKQGETLGSYYMESLKNAKTPEELTKGLASAYADMTSRGLGEYTQQIGQYADLKSKELNIQEDNKFYAGNFNALASGMAENDIKYNGKTMKGKDIAKEITDYTSNPKMRYELLKNAVETGKLVKDNAVGIDKKGNVTGGSFQRDVFGNVVSQEGFINKGSQVYIDRGTIGKYEEGTDPLASADVLADFSKMQTSFTQNKIAENRSRIAESRLDRVPVIDQKTGKIREVLQDFQGNRYEITNGKKGSLVDTGEVKLSSFTDRKEITKTALKGLEEGKREVVKKINDTLNSVRFGGKPLLDSFDTSFKKTAFDGTTYLTETSLNMLMGYLKEVEKKRPDDLEDYEKVLLNTKIDVYDSQTKSNKSKRLLDYWKEDYQQRKDIYDEGRYSFQNQFNESYNDEPMAGAKTEKINDNMEKVTDYSVNTTTYIVRINGEEKKYTNQQEAERYLLNYKLFQETNTKNKFNF